MAHTKKLWNIRYFSPLFAVHCSFQNQVNFVFEGRDDEDRRSSLDSSSEVSIYLDTIIVNFDMQWGHAAAPFDVLAFSPLFVAETARDNSFQEKNVGFSVMLPTGRVNYKIDYVLKKSN